MTFGPAVLSLLGERAWRLPSWLDRILPNADVEGLGLPEAQRGPGAAAPAPGIASGRHAARGLGVSRPGPAPA